MPNDNFIHSMIFGAHHYCSHRFFCQYDSVIVIKLYFSLSVGTNLIPEYDLDLMVVAG